MERVPPLVSEIYSVGTPKLPEKLICLRLFKGGTTNYKILLEVGLKNSLRTPGMVHISLVLNDCLLLLF